MALAYGHVLTLDRARELGVLSTAEAIVRESPDGPWKALRPVDVPVEQTQHVPGESKQPESTMKTVSLRRALHHLRKGGLHRALGIPEDQPIPQARLEAAKHSSNEHVRHMANFAATMESWHH